MGAMDVTKPYKFIGFGPHPAHAPHEARGALAGPTLGPTDPTGSSKDHAASDAAGTVRAKTLPHEALKGPIGDPPKNTKIYQTPQQPPPTLPHHPTKMRGTSGTSDSQFKNFIL